MLMCNQQSWILFTGICTDFFYLCCLINFLPPLNSQRDNLSVSGFEVLYVMLNYSAVISQQSDGFRCYLTFIRVVFCWVNASNGYKIYRTLSRGAPNALHYKEWFMNHCANGLGISSFCSSNIRGSGYDNFCSIMRQRVVSRIEMWGLWFYQQCLTIVITVIGSKYWHNGRMIIVDPLLFTFWLVFALAWCLCLFIISRAAWRVTTLASRTDMTGSPAACFPLHYFVWATLWR